jgi:electron transfer flavoprotein beta subunit
MKIVVCVKEVIDVTFPFVLDPKTLEPVETDLFYKINPADKCAVEMALRLQETLGGEVCYLTFGPPRTERMLKDCLAMGGKEAIRIWEDRPFLGSQAKAVLLAKAVTRFSPDLILCGARSLDEGSGETPVAIAELLDLPQVSGVTDLSVSPDATTVCVKRKLERGRREEIECPLPAVLTIEPGTRTPRYAALPGVLSAYKTPINCLSGDDLEVDSFELNERNSLLRFVAKSLPRPRPKKTFNMESGLTAEQRMELMMSGGLKKTGSDLIEGSPPDVAKKLAAILRDKIATPQSAKA